MAFLMRDTTIRVLVGLALLTVAPACKPNITTDTYFCGPEELCPPKLSCHLGPLQSEPPPEGLPPEPARFAYTCVTSVSAKNFSCSENTSDQEPDDEPAMALDLMAISCGSHVVQADWGCIDEALDRDHYRFSLVDTCFENNPRFEATLSYPLGTAPLSLDLLDDSGAIIASGSICSASSDEGGTEERCIDLPDLPVGEYVLRVQIDTAGNADCDGDCAFNRYRLLLSTPVS